MLREGPQFMTSSSKKKSDCKCNRLQYFLCWWMSLAWEIMWGAQISERRSEWSRCSTATRGARTGESSTSERRLSGGVFIVWQAGRRPRGWPGLSFPCRLGGITFPSDDLSFPEKKILTYDLNPDYIQVRVWKGKFGAPLWSFRDPK